MCLGIPGRVLEIDGGEGLPTGRVDFGGAVKDVCLAYVPDVTVGEYVIVHVGFAISKVDEAEAQRTLAILREMGDLAARELDPGSDPALAGAAEPATALDAGAAEAGP